MGEAALVVLALASSYLGIALFALSQKPHGSSVAGVASRAPLPRATRLRCLALGTAALALGLGASLWAEGASFGSLLWVLGLAGAGLSVTFTLSYRPHWLRAVQRTIARG
jgi:type IV secretory pathway TrbD component